jgi:hypothetical protein
MSVHQLCQWLNDTGLATAIRESDLMFPVIETVHVLAITLLAGTVAIVDLRLLGLILKRERVSEVAGQVLPLTWAGFAVMLLSGLLLFLAEAAKSYTNTAFRLKMLLMMIAGINPLIFHATVYRGVASWDQSPVVPRRARGGGAIPDVVERDHRRRTCDRIFLRCRCYLYFNGRHTRHCSRCCAIPSGALRRLRQCTCWRWQYSGARC